MFRHLLPLALAVVAITLTGGVPDASASTIRLSPHLRLPETPPSSKAKLPRMRRSKQPTARTPRQGVLAKTSDTTFTVGGPQYVANYTSGYSDVFWWSLIGRYTYIYWVQTWSSGEWYATDQYYYSWSSSRWTYYGHYRCWKEQSSNGVVIVGPTPDHTTRCSWV
jgi:hypothetical protein